MRVLSVTRAFVTRAASLQAGLSRGLACAQFHEPWLLSRCRTPTSPNRSGVGEAYPDGGRLHVRSESSPTVESVDASDADCCGAIPGLGPSHPT